jgi:ubiquinone/menaquinone biosynthesis C-methylase UbiE
MFLRPGEIIRKLREKKYVLPGMNGADFGCGSGYFTSLLAKEVGADGKIYAIDVQEDVIKEAQEFLKNLNINNVTFLVKDLEINSGLENNTLDFVFISQVLYQSDELEKIIKEAFRVLRHGGYLIILEPQPESLLFSNQKSYRPEEITFLLEKNNFKIIEIEQDSNYYLLIVQK